MTSQAVPADSCVRMAACIGSVSRYSALIVMSGSAFLNAAIAASMAGRSDAVADTRIALPLLELLDPGPELQAAASRPTARPVTVRLRQRRMRIVGSLKDGCTGR
jgi:hypothetical protein